MNALRVLAAPALVLLLCVSGSVALNGYFWHVTDFHFDPNYTMNGDAAKMCWRSANEVGARPAGPWGDYRCDSPQALVESVLSAMKKIGPNPDFVLWTGDDKAHVGDSYFSDDKVFNLISNLTHQLTATFPSVKILPVLGNHDWFPTHLLPPNRAKLYDRLADLWQSWIGNESADKFRDGGFYSFRLPNGVRLLALNTVFYYKKNKIIQFSKDKNPANQFTWLENILLEARRTGEKVYVASHVPPGIFERHIMDGGYRWFHDEFNSRFVDLVSKFGDVILAHFFAHQHTDTFRVFYDENGHPSSVMFIAPSVTPWNTTLSQVGPNNPGVRLIRYNTSSGQLTDIEQYFLNLSLANSLRDPKWELEYSARSSYSLSSFSPKSWHRLAETFATKNRSFFDRYYRHNTVSYASPYECDDKCQRYHYCAITCVRFDVFDSCWTPSAAAAASH